MLVSSDAEENSIKLFIQDNHKIFILPLTLTFGRAVPDIMGMQWPDGDKSWPSGQHYK